MTNIEKFIKELTDNNIIITGKSAILYDEIVQKYIDKEKLEFISILEIRNKIYDSLPIGNNLTAFDVFKKMGGLIDYLDNISIKKNETNEINKQEIVSELKKHLLHNPYRNTYIIKEQNFYLLVESLVKTLKKIY